MKKHRSIQLETTEARRKYLVSEPDNHTIKYFLEIY